MIAIKADAHKIDLPFNFNFACISTKFPSHIQRQIVLIRLQLSASECPQNLGREFANHSMRKNASECCKNRIDAEYAIIS